MLISLILLLNIQVQAASMVINKSTNITGKNVVTLGDISTFTAMDSQAAETIKDLRLTDVPSIGEKREFSSEAISSLLRPLIKEYEERTQSKLNVFIPNQVLIESKLPTFDRDTIESLLRSQWKKTCTECEFKIEALSIPLLKMDHISRWEIESSAQIPRGSFSIPMFVTDNQQAVVTHWIKGRVYVSRRVPVAKRMIYVGERLQESDFEFVLRDVTFAQDAAPINSSDLVGRRLKAAVRVNDVLWMNSLDRDKALVRGEAVRVVSGEALWEVSMTAIAEQDGFIGDTVNVRNPRSNKVLSGVVVAKGEVEIK